jgi:hypothetical protein
LVVVDVQDVADVDLVEADVQADVQDVDLVEDAEAEAEAEAEADVQDVDLVEDVEADVQDVDLVEDAEADVHVGERKTKMKSKQFTKLLMSQSL